MIPFNDNVRLSLTPAVTIALVGHPAPSWLSSAQSPVMSPPIAFGDSGSAGDCIILPGLYHFSSSELSLATRTEEKARDRKNDEPWSDHGRHAR